MSTTVRISSSRSRSGLWTVGDEILDGLGIGQITPEGGVRQQQMISDQPGDRFGLRLVQPEPRAKLHRNIGAKLAMVAAAALGDIVQQHRDIKHPARCDLLEQRGRQRMVLRQLASLDPRQQADRPDRMFVDGIMVVHVELHLGDHSAEVGNEASENASLVHPPEDHIGLVSRRQHVEEQRVAARVVADLVDQPRVAR